MERRVHHSGSARFLCVMALVISMLASCASTSVSDVDSSTITSAVSVSEEITGAVTDESDSVPPTFDGATVRVLCEADATCSDLCFAEQDQSERSRLAFERDSAIKEKFDLTISYEESADLFSDFESCFASDDAPHVVYARGGGGMSELMLYGYLDDVGQYLGNEVYDSVGMSSSALRQLSIDNKLYMITGAPMSSSVSSAIATGYDKSTLEKYGYSADYIDRLVYDGLWTHDAMHAIAKVCSNNAVSGNEDTLYYLWQGMGAKIIDKLPTDMPVITLYNSRNLFLFEHVHEYHAEVLRASDEGGALFVVDSLGAIGTALGSETSLAPLPAFYERGGYVCVMDFADTYFTAIPRGADDPALAGCYLGALYTESLDTVYQETLREFSFGDESMLDVILQSRSFDLLDMYGIGHIVRSAFSPAADIADFDELLAERAEFAERALEITLGQTLENR